MLNPLIQDHQTDFPHEQECLLNTYNVYEWNGMHLTPEGIPVVKLKVLPPIGVDGQRVVNDVGHIVDPRDKNDEYEIEPEWLGKRGEIARTRHMPPGQLTDKFFSLISSYQNRYNEKIRLLNTPGRHHLDVSDLNYTDWANRKTMLGAFGNIGEWLNTDYVVEGRGMRMRVRMTSVPIALPAAAQGQRINNIYEH